MNSRDAITLAGLRRIGISLTWPEAVAVVLEVTEQVKRGRGTFVTPDLDHVSLNPDGTLTILPGSPIPANPVRQAAQLLKKLIQDRSAPDELHQLLAQNDRALPACAWIEEFTTALAYFERPDRRQIIAELAHRAAALQPGMPATPNLPPGEDTRPRSAGGFVWSWRRWFGQ